MGPGAVGFKITMLGPRVRWSGARLTVFREAVSYLRSHGGTFDRVVESVSTRPFAAHRIVGDRAVALYMQTAEEVWGLEFPLPISWLGQHVLEPLWIRRMRNARVIAISPSTALALRRHGVHSEAIIPPGCDPPPVMRARGAPSAAPRLLWIGRLVRTKLPDDAMLAFKRVRAVFPDATLDLVGGGYLEAKIQSQHYPGVTVHGLTDEVVKTSLLARADLLLLPGTREGWGIVAMEAASYGVPVVAYDIPGLRDVVLQGVTGVLVPRVAEALGAAAAGLLADLERWTTISIAAQERAKDFTWDRSARELLATLTLSGRPKPPKARRPATAPRSTTVPVPPGCSPNNALVTNTKAVTPNGTAITWPASSGAEDLSPENALNGRRNATWRITPDPHRSPPPTEREIV